MSTPPFSPAMAANKIIEMRDVTLSYDEGAEVLRQADLVMREGDFRFLTGPSGAGKTTLLKLIYLALKPTSGTLKIFGEEVSDLNGKRRPDIRRRIGVVFQEFRLLDHLTAYENVALPMRVMGLKDQDYRADVMELLSWVGLGDRVTAKPPVLSGGQKQRVALARALVSKPDLILADEPTGNVDPEMGGKIMQLLLELNRLGTAVIVATHDFHVVRRIPKKILRLKEGHLTLHQPLAELQGAANT